MFPETAFQGIFDKVLGAASNCIFIQLHFMTVSSGKNKWDPILV